LTSARSSNTSSRAESVDAGAGRLGVGLLYNPALPEFVERHADAFDYLEFIPDREWHDTGVSDQPRPGMNERARAFFSRVRESRPLVCHSIGLSIGSAALFDTAHVERIARLAVELDVAWHSDHLSFARLPLADHEMHTALSLPVAYDEDMLAMLVDRARHVLAAVPRPFLLENNVYYVDQPEQDMREPEFLGRLARLSGCGLLLDLHNVHVNAANHGFSADSFLADLDLSRVAEIHIAGGDELLGFATDAHAGPVAPPVWRLLEDTLRAAPWIRGVTFEFHESSFPMLKHEGIRAELERARRIWDRVA
jgi:uncharacterized protein (UPF0276 family)